MLVNYECNDGVLEIWHVPVSGTKLNIHRNTSEKDQKWGCTYVDLFYFLNYRRVKGLKGKRAWEYQRTISDTSLTSVRSPSPTPSPITSPTASPSLSPQFHTNYHQQTTTGLIPQVRSASDVEISTLESNLDYKSVTARAARRYTTDVILGVYILDLCFK